MFPLIIAISLEHVHGVTNYAYLYKMKIDLSTYYVYLIHTCNEQYVNQNLSLLLLSILINNMLTLSFTEGHTRVPWAIKKKKIQEYRDFLVRNMGWKSTIVWGCKILKHMNFIYGVKNKKTHGFCQTALVSLNLTKGALIISWRANEKILLEPKPIA
jgi:hypothetical protein